MKTKYSKEQFEGFTHRFIVEFETGEANKYTMHIYSNNGSQEMIKNFIHKNKNSKVDYFKIIYVATKEQDEMASKLIDETLSGL